MTRLHLGMETRSVVPVASSGLALKPVGGAGGGGPPPRKVPPRTALGPATRVTVMVTVPPAATLIGTLTQAPCEKSVLMLAAWGPEPSLIVMVSRRPIASQSTTYIWMVPLYAVEKLRWSRTWLAS